ncbi:MAG: hypothetical protein FJZ00_09955 [Candidatus Sericytochromatia bacterium]|uniref:DUF4149 domain-containing protein n=1 Tax=Candidatus Tanganyikabacteria bacterium TaxID=2961651 RepID=A0A937X423_9BACT|nr:hypothetical protein [Candidatus Tanganyikabacteria bacterium]
MTRVIYRIAAAVWLGTVVFLAFALSPVALGLVEKAEVPTLLRIAAHTLYPCAVGAGLLAAGMLALRLSWGDRELRKAKIALVAGALILTASGLWVSLGLELAHGQDFTRLHRDVQGLLGVSLLILLAVVGLG